MGDSLLSSKGFPADNILEPLLNSLPDIIHSVDKDGKIVFTNTRAPELLGYTMEELLNLNIYELYAPELQSQVKKGFKTLKQKGDFSVRESLLQTKSGELLPVEIRSFGVYDNNGEFLRTFSILRDIREIKEMRDNLMHAERLTGIGQLASCVVHDIHNPLMVIQLYTEMLLQDLSRYINESYTGDVEEYLTQTQKATEKIQKLLAHLRNFSRRQADTLEKAELNSLADDALFMVMNKLISQKITVIRNNKDEDFPVYGSIIQLEQVLMNIFSNACDAMIDRKEKKLSISFEKVSENEIDYYQCSVVDTGAGIPADKIDAIFTSFYTTKKQGQGTGLGLSICQEVMEKHEGKITVESKVGRGTEFKLLFPVDNGTRPES